MNKTSKSVVITPPNSVKWMSKTFLRHTLIKKYFWHFCWHLSLYIFTIWKSIVYNLFCRDGIYFDNHHLPGTIKLNKGNKGRRRMTLYIISISFSAIFLSFFNTWRIQFSLLNLNLCGLRMQSRYGVSVSQITTDMFSLS